MEWLHPIALRVIAAVVLIYFGLGLFNVQWLLRLRILGAMAAGALIVAAAGYPLVRPEIDIEAISMFTGQISIADVAILLILGFAAGAAGALICHPIGSALGPFAAPTGVATLAMLSGGLSQILANHGTLEQQNAVYGALRWELLFWLGICAAGYCGAWLTAKLLKQKTVIAGQSPKIENNANYWINCLIAAGIGAAVVYFALGIFAPNSPQTDLATGTVVIGHPGSRQIAFGVFVTVAIAAFAAKHLLNAHFIPVILGAAAIYIFAFSKYVGSETLTYMVKNWPPHFVPGAAPNSIYATLPVQFSPFAVLGAMTGYWISIYMKHHAENTE